MPPYARWIGLLATVLVLAAVLVVARGLPVAERIEQLQQWLEELGAWAPLAFVLIYVLATLLMLPAWPLTVAAGALFGLLWGTLIASMAATTGAALAFLIARYLARQAVARQLARYPKFQAVDQAIGRQGWKIVALLRLSPAVPFNLQNYLYGLTAIRFWPCVLVSWPAMLPGALLYAYVGYLGAASLEEAAGAAPPATRAQWSLRIIGLLATLAVTLYLTHLARRAVKNTGLDSDP